MLLAVVAAAAAAQPKFTYADIVAGRFTPNTVGGVRSTANGEFYTAIGDGGKICKYRYKTGELDCILFDPMNADWGGHPHRIFDYTLSPDEKLMLLKTDSKPLYRRSTYSSYVVANLADGSLTPVAASDSVRYARFSPDGKRVAYVLDNNIFIKTLADGTVEQITNDGRYNLVINGVPDWVYEEEWVIDDALRWSPDSRRIAFLRFDESNVKDYSLDFYGDCYPATDDLYPRKFTYKYPVAGEDNSVVSLHVCDLTDGSVSTVDIGSDPQQYVPFFGWTPDGTLYFFKINRLQNNLEIITDDLAGSQRVIYHETSDKYIDNISNDMIRFLPDGDRFIVRNETATGYSHLYMYSMNRGLLWPITAGEWNVTEIVGMADGRIWYMSTETSPLRNNLYSVKLDGSGKRCLTPDDGFYGIAPSAQCKYYLSYFSNAQTPTTVSLWDGKGRFIRMLEDNAPLKTYLAEIGYPVKEFFEFTVERDGQPVALNCYMVKPVDFDPDKKYPVLFTQYSGPGSQSVQDVWNVDWEDVLVQYGYIVVCMDPRGTGGRGEAFKKSTYGHLGELETEDFIEFARYIGGLPYVDPARLGIYGGSYGGFMALNCILHGNDVFSMAIALAPVTSWRYYDSVYTERFNSLPQLNPEGYDRPSPIFYADRLKGRLLLIHGTADDNVHPQNSFKLIHELVKADKYFDTMFYTDDNHSIRPTGRYHVRQKMLDYCLQNL